MFWKDGLSIDETKSSALIIAFVITLIFTLVMYVLRAEIIDNLLTLNLFLAGLIGGYNVAHDLTDYLGKKSSSDSQVRIKEIELEIEERKCNQ